MNNDLAQWIWKRLAKCLPTDGWIRKDLVELAKSLRALK
jgi:hypothetical protein